jgi:polysaccharide biosynthesis transport protein
MELGATLRLLRRWWPTLVIATWVAAVTGFLVASALPPRYEAETQVLIGPPTGDVDTLRASSMLVQTYAQLASSDQVLIPALKAAGAAISPDAARDYLRTSGDDVTRIVTIRFEDANPQLAAGVVSKVAAQLAAFSGGDTSRPEGQVSILVNPQVPQQSVAPRTALLVLLAALMGLLGAVALALIFDRLFPTVRGEDDVPALVGAPSLATIPGTRLDRDEPPVIGELVRPTAGQTAYRLLASRLGLDSSNPGLLHVVGIDPSAGAGEVAANVAAVLASAGQRVALVDADPDRVAATLLATDPASLLDDESDEIVEIETRLGFPVIRAAGPGQITIPGEAVDEIVADFKKDGVPVILVGPPIGGTAVAVQWARRAIGTLVVIRQDGTRRQDLAVAGESLRYVGATIVGAALVASGRSLPGMKRLSQWRKSPPRSPDETSGWSQYGGSVADGGTSTAPSAGARSSSAAYDDDADRSPDRLTEPSA